MRLFHCNVILSEEKRNRGIPCQPYGVPLKFLVAIKDKQVSATWKTSNCLSEADVSVLAPLTYKLSGQGLSGRRQLGEPLGETP